MEPAKLPAINILNLCVKQKPCWTWLKLLATWLSFFLLAPPQLKKSASSCDPQTFETRRRSKELSSDLSALCFVQDLQRFIYARIEPLIDPLLLQEQVDFSRGKPTVDQAILLMQNNPDAFETKK